MVGTEARKFRLKVGGRNLVVQEECPEPKKQDVEDVAKFVNMASKSHLEAARMLCYRNHTDMARFRRAFRENQKDRELVDFIKGTFQTTLANFASSVAFPLAEVLSDEVHLATMGLSDNFGAIVDVVCSSDKHLLQEVRQFYGIKFGDGRYEVKSQDGKGDREKLEKDVSFALKGKKKELVVAKIRGLDNEWSKSDGKEFLSGDAGSFEELVEFLANASPAQLTEFQVEAKGDDKIREMSAKFSDGDKELERAIFACAAPRHSFWTLRLMQAVSPKLNKKLLLRVISANDPSQRKTIAAMYEDQSKNSLMDKFEGNDDEMLFLRAVFGDLL